MEPSEAEAFMEGLSEGELREQVLVNLVERFSNLDSKKARRYFEEVPEGEQKEKLRKRLEHEL